MDGGSVWVGTDAWQFLLWKWCCEVTQSAVGPRTRTGPDT